MGLLVASSRVGASFSPFIVTELKYIHPALPFSLMGLSNIVAAIFCLRLRETKGFPTPETINDSISLLRGLTLENVNSTRVNTNSVAVENKEHGKGS